MAFDNPLKRVFGKLSGLRSESGEATTGGAGDRRASGHEVDPPLVARAPSLTVTKIALVRLRERVRVQGKIAELTVRPRNGTDWLEAKLVDETGSLQLIWIGRNTIPGVKVEGQLIAEGCLSDTDGGQRIYNPYYELIAS